ncbi:PREDICTED: GILT-like protein C02D5.2 [Ceratosolen solmsi marchali]|uniref:GILT-like protein C02D5.2 n=1 Tax=Ceratosolen solmsi marchali TaxID=326594 RepID=A0AAJ6YVP4_9HYME|nr:PREDICTED: GILT-like protein C02D5.2 [Ceratosolen solmsi marchali]
MKISNLRIKLLISVFIIVFLWQISKLWVYYLKQSSSKEIDKKQKFEPILVTVYYEALCPDSKYFIIKQVVPTFNSIGNYIEIQLIPYGKAETTVVKDDYTFECQHGAVECAANIIHACSINKIKDTRKQLEVVACMIKNNMHPMSILRSCTSQMDEYKSIVNCAQSIEGRRLLMKYGEITKALDPAINFIPTITLDSEMDNQILILKNLLRQICQRIEIPLKECKS